MTAPTVSPVANIAMARVRPRELLGLGQTLARLPEICDLLGDSQADLLVQFAPKRVAAYPDLFMLWSQSDISV